ncbi:DUF4760 domain-containing protein [Roseobacter ponti]|uniref:Uncharacterized protein n=1 Tax=Roseobacter ponti TaxID=1891787 RepID=A0A858SSG0_9RHOB|nr:hypothetical protein [Roseobacter ponti]QJF51849.1 hypothetical protein G3256_12085 [Roseobacter ponti]
MAEDRESGISLWLRRFLGTGAGIATAAGVVLGVWEYRQRGDLTRARETMDMITVWEQQGARDAYRALSRDLETKIATELSEADVLAADQSRRAQRNLYANISRSVLATGDQKQNFEDVVYFFSRLSLCIDAGLCDDRISKVFFGDTFHSFVLVFSTQISAREQVIAGFDDALVNLERTFARIEE